MAHSDCWPCPRSRATSFSFLGVSLSISPEDWRDSRRSALTKRATNRYFPDTTCSRYAASVIAVRLRALSESANCTLSLVEEELETLLTPHALYTRLDCGACLMHSTGHSRRSRGSLADAKLGLAEAGHEVVRAIKRIGCEDRDRRCSPQTRSAAWRQTLTRKMAMRGTTGAARSDDAATNCDMVFQHALVLSAFYATCNTCTQINSSDIIIIIQPRLKLKTS